MNILKLTAITCLLATPAASSDRTGSNPHFHLGTAWQVVYTTKKNGPNRSICFASRAQDGGEAMIMLSIMRFAGTNARGIKTKPGNKISGSVDTATCVTLDPEYNYEIRAAAMNGPVELRAATSRCALMKPGAKNLGMCKGMAGRGHMATRAGRFTGE